MSKNPVVCNGEENGKVIRKPHADLDHQRTLISSRGSPLVMPAKFGWRPFPRSSLLSCLPNDRTTYNDHITSASLAGVIIGMLDDACRHWTKPSCSNFLTCSLDYVNTLAADALGSRVHHHTQLLHVHLKYDNNNIKWRRRRSKNRCHGTGNGVSPLYIRLQKMLLASKHS